MSECLPGCICMCGHEEDIHLDGRCWRAEGPGPMYCGCSDYEPKVHAPGCPNAPKPEPRGAMIVDLEGALKRSLLAPKPEPPPDVASRDKRWAADQDACEDVASEHPEDTCGRCGGPNVKAWHAPSPLWNAVMRTDRGDIFGVVCPQCFSVLAIERGIAGPDVVWCFRADRGLLVELPTTNHDGRVWDDEACLWVEKDSPRGLLLSRSRETNGGDMERLRTEQIVSQDAASEPDFDGGEAWLRMTVSENNLGEDEDQNALDAYLALRSENTALKAENEWLQKQLESCQRTMRSIQR